MNNKTIEEQLFEPVPTEIMPEEAYECFKTLPATCESLSRMTNQSVYVIDYSKRAFFFVSSHPLFLCGYTPQEVKEMGYAFYKKVISPEDLQMLSEINEFGWALFDKVPPSEIPNVCFSYDFYLHHKNGSKILVNQKLVPTFVAENNTMWMALCTVSLSPRKSSGNVVFTLNNRSQYYSYDFDQKKIIEHKPPQLTKREEEVLALLMRGLTAKETAYTLCITADTVQNHRKSIIRAFGADSGTNAASLFFSRF